MSLDRIFSALMLGLVANGVLAASNAAPIGMLQSEGRFQVVSAHSEQPVTIHQPEYAFYSGDTVIAGSEAVINLNAGGGLGVTKGSKVTVVLDSDGAVKTDVHSGALLYAFPDGRHDFVFRVGNFSIHGQVPEVQAMQVSDAGSSVGTVERMDDGNLKVAVRSGSLHIFNGASVRYQVSAGESVGLLDLPQHQIRTQAAAPQDVARGGRPLVLFQSPERVGTNEEFLIRWEAFEPVDGDFVVIAKSGAEPDEFESLVSSDEGNELEFEAPGIPGDYEIRFLDGETGEIKRFVYLDVVPDLIGAYWWDRRLIAGVIAVAPGAVTVFIGAAGDDDPDPVSP